MSAGESSLLPLPRLWGCAAPLAEQARCEAAYVTVRDHPQCGRPGTYRIDGHAYCTEHAKMIALDLLIRFASER